MNYTRLLMLNILIAAISFEVIYFFDWPIEVIGVIGIAWVLTSSTSMLLRRRIKL